MGNIVVFGNHVYASEHQFGAVWVIDVSDPTEPVVVDSDDSYSVGDLSIDGSYLYASSFSDGLTIYDISNPAVLKEIAFLETAGFAMAVGADGDTAVVADKPGLWVIDVSDPTDPTAMAGIEVPPGYSALDVKVAGSYLYTEYNGTFRIFNISDPANPVEVGTVDLFGGRLTNKPPSATFSAKTGDEQLIFYQNDLITLFLTDIG